MKKAVYKEEIKDDFYTEEMVEDCFDGDGITAEEQGFMLGYIMAGG